MLTALSERAGRLLDRVYPLVAVPTDTERDRILKSLTIVVGAGGVVMTSLTAVTTIVVGLPMAFSIGLFLYAALMAVAVGAFVATKRGVNYAITAMLVGNLAISWFGTWYQGGIAPSGANVLWGMICPVVATLAFGRRAAFSWFVAFLVVLMLAIFVERADAPELSPDTVRGSFAIVLGGVSIFLFFLFLYFIRERDRAQDEADYERARSDALLANILPDEIAGRLKDGERVIADRFDEASVLFADIADFTPMSGTMEPQELVELLNDVFIEFDRLADRYGVEKIKTIGDAYMVVGGLPPKPDDHLGRVADMALDLNRILTERSDAHPIKMRIGLHAGPAVAGVIGSKKFIYDVWGDTVNTASRLEAYGLPERIHTSEAVQRRLGDRYQFESRGVVELKGMGPTPTWLLTGRKAETTNDASSATTS